MPPKHEYAQKHFIASIDFQIVYTLLPEKTYYSISRMFHSWKCKSSTQAAFLQVLLLCGTDTRVNACLNTTSSRKESRGNLFAERGVIYLPYPSNLQ